MNHNIIKQFLEYIKPQGGVYKSQKTLTTEITSEIH